MGIRDGMIKGKNNNFPELPYETSGHCIARIDNEHVFLAGGNTANAVIYNELQNNFTVLPDITCKRYRPACTTVVLGNVTFLMVVGGNCFTDRYSSTSVDVFDMSSLDSGGRWEKNTNILHDVGIFDDGAYATYNDDRGDILVGGNWSRLTELDLSRKILTFDDINFSFKKQAMSLQYNRQGHSIVVIPDGD